MLEMSGADSLRRRSGTPTRTNEQRTRQMATFTLSREALAHLKKLATERVQTRSGTLEQLILDAPLASSRKRE
jgi:hypothetical protein